MATWTVIFRDHDRDSLTVEAENLGSLDAVPGGAQRETLLLLDGTGAVVLALPGDAVLSIRKHPAA